MRTIVGTVAKLCVLGALLVFGSIDLATPSYANGGWWENSDNCHWKHHKLYCSGTRATDSSSVGLFPTRCDGVLGFWTAVGFANGETLCIAQSTADFYHNGSLIPTCTKKYFSRKDWEWHEVTTDGFCPAKHHHSHSE